MLTLRCSVTSSLVWASRRECPFLLAFTWLRDSCWSQLSWRRRLHSGNSWRWQSSYQSSGHPWHQENPVTTLPLGRVQRGVSGQSRTSQNMDSVLCDVHQRDIHPSPQGCARAPGLSHFHSSGQPGLWGGLRVMYDAAFRHQAFITGNRQWSKVNPSLYSICFSGAARTGVRCELCLSLSHPTHKRTLVCDSDSDVSTGLKTLESAVLAFTFHAPLQQRLQLRAKSSDVCRNWNAGKCRMSQCRFRHACIVCGSSLCMLRPSSLSPFES